LVPLSVEFYSNRDLYLGFMPFLNEGGVFVRTPRQYDLGDEVKLHILLPGALEESIVQGEVCWLTPVGAQNGTPPGVGITFVKDRENNSSTFKFFRANTNDVAWLLVTT
jgi:type IV pilus assembly protein PilZ